MFLALLQLLIPFRFFEAEEVVAVIQFHERALDHGRIFEHERDGFRFIFYPGLRFLTEATVGGTFCIDQTIGRKVFQPGFQLRLINAFGFVIVKGIGLATLYSRSTSLRLVFKSVLAFRCPMMRAHGTW